MVKNNENYFRCSALLGARICLTVISFLWLGVLALRAANYYVATNGTDSPACTDWANAASNIQYAVDLAIGAGDTVWVSNGTYCVTNQITITNNITVMSTNGYASTIVYADWPTYTNIRCFYVSRTGIVDGFTISNGHYNASNDYNGGGGAFLTTGTIQNCYFANNVCSNGGVYSGGGGLFIKDSGTVSNCTFFSNTVHVAGGSGERVGGGAIDIYNNANVNVKVLKCIMSKNQIMVSGRGGGICGSGSPSATPLVSNCTFNANIAGNHGAAVMLSGGLVTDCIITNHTGGASTIRCAGAQMKNCLVANNDVPSGNAVFFDYGGKATNCIISGNRGGSTRGGGGAMLVGDASSISIFDRCTFSNNLCNSGAGGGAISITNNGQVRNCLIHNNTNTSSVGNGGGVFLGNAARDKGVLYGLINCTIVNNYSTNGGGGVAAFETNNYIANCIIAGNSAFSNTYAEILNTSENSNNYWYCCANPTSAPLAVGQGNITNDPAFAGADNWRLSGDSPCVNKGTNISWTTNSYDLDGRTRIRYGTVDMGAYERINEGAIYNLW